MRPPLRIEQLVRDLFSSARRDDAKKALGWDDTQVSRFLSGAQGIPLCKLDILMKEADLAITSRKYFDAVTTLGAVGMNCECARQGLGECGRT